VQVGLLAAGAQYPSSYGHEGAFGVDAAGRVEEGAGAAGEKLRQRVLLHVQAVEPARKRGAHPVPVALLEQAQDAFRRVLALEVVARIAQSPGGEGEGQGPFGKGAGAPLRGQGGIPGVGRGGRAAGRRRLLGKIG